jgi:hypothetical protein
MTDQAAAGVKLDVITGPGRYEVVHDEPGRVQPGQLVPVVRDTEWGDNPKTPWLADLGCGLQVFIGNDGVSPSGGFRVRRADAAARIASLEASNAALQAELDRLHAIMDSDHAGFLRELILTAYSKAPFNADPQAVIDDAKAMQRAIEGEAK